MQIALDSEKEGRWRKQLESHLNPFQNYLTYILQTFSSLIIYFSKGEISKGDKEFKDLFDRVMRSKDIVEHCLLHLSPTVWKFLLSLLSSPSPSPPTRPLSLSSPPTPTPLDSSPSRPLSTSPLSPTLSRSTNFPAILPSPSPSLSNPSNHSRPSQNDNGKRLSVKIEEKNEEVNKSDTKEDNEKEKKEVHEKTNKETEKIQKREKEREDRVEETKEKKEERRFEELTKEEIKKRRQTMHSPSAVRKAPSVSIAHQRPSPLPPPALPPFRPPSLFLPSTSSSSPRPKSILSLSFPHSLNIDYKNETKRERAKLKKIVADFTSLHPPPSNPPPAPPPAIPLVSPPAPSSVNIIVGKDDTNNDDQGNFIEQPPMEVKLEHSRPREKSVTEMDELTKIEGKIEEKENEEEGWKSREEDWIPTSPRSTKRSHSISIDNLDTPSVPLSDPFSPPNSPRDDIDIIEKSKKEVDIRDQIVRIIREILISEANYLNFLEILIKHYLKPLCGVYPEFTKATRQVEIINDFNTKLFHSFSEIYLSILMKSNIDIKISQITSKSIIPLINDRPIDDDRQYSLYLADLFSQILYTFASKMKCYTKYIYKYDQLAGMVNKMLLKKKFKEIIQTYDAKSTTLFGISLKFLDLLIMPIQRLPRYTLLLRELQKCREGEGEEGVEDITMAIRAISETTEYINDTKKVRDTKLDLLSVAQKVSPPGKDPINLVANGRRYIKEGFLWRHWPSLPPSPRHFFLFTDMLITASYLDEAFLSEGGMELEEVIYFNSPEGNMRVEDLQDEGIENGFELAIAKEGQRYEQRFKVSAKTAPEKTLWMLMLSASLADPALSQITRERGDDLMESCVMSGWLSKKSSISAWRHRYCKLRGKSLYLYSSPDDTKCLAVIDLSLYIISLSTMGQASFELIPSDDKLRRHYFKIAMDHADIVLRRWLTSFEQQNVHMNEEVFRTLKRISWDETINKLQERGVEHYHRFILSKPQSSSLIPTPFTK